MGENRKGEPEGSSQEDTLESLQDKPQSSPLKRRKGHSLSSICLEPGIFIQMTSLWWCLTRAGMVGGK